MRADLELESQELVSCLVQELNLSPLGEHQVIRPAEPSLWLQISCILFLELNPPEMCLPHSGYGVNLGTLFTASLCNPFVSLCH